MRTSKNTSRKNTTEKNSRRQNTTNNQQNEYGEELTNVNGIGNAIIEKIDDIWFVNPGCMSSYTQNSYCYIVVHEDKFVAKIVYLNSVGVR